jgi:hypothetical protein
LFELLSPYAAWFRNGLTGQSPVEQLTSGHISPFNDGQGFFAQFDPAKELMRSSGSSGSDLRNENVCPCWFCGQNFPSKRLFLDSHPRKWSQYKSLMIVAVQITIV